MPPLMLGVGSLGAMAAVTSWIAHRIGVRIRRVERQVARIAEGDFHELDLGRERDEVQDLSRSINRMCVQLREMRRTIQQSERTRLLAQFAAGLAHQLRNSLTGARHERPAPRAGGIPAPDGDQSLDVALRQLAMTEEQVKGLLSLGRVERRPPEVFDLRAAPRGRRPAGRSVVPARQGRSSHQPRGVPLELLADEAGVRAAVLNLALNAIEAAGPGGTVSLEAVARRRRGDHRGRRHRPGSAARAGRRPVRAVRHEQARRGRARAWPWPSRSPSEHGGRLSWTRAGGETRFSLALPRRRREREGGRMSRILIVDDEASICWAFREFLADEGHQVEVAASAEEGLRIADAGGLDAVVLDVRLPGMDGLTAMRPFRDRIGEAPDHRHHGVRQPRDRRPGDGGRGLRLPGQAVRPRPGGDRRQAGPGQGEAPRPRRGADGRAGRPEALIGTSPAMQELFKSIALVAPTDVPVLITGESGTGKELVARAIHRHSARRAGPFLPVCLAALSPGLVERELFGHLRGSFTGADPGPQGAPRAGRRRDGPPGRGRRHPARTSRSSSCGPSSTARSRRSATPGRGRPTSGSSPRRTGRSPS